MKIYRIRPTITQASQQNSYSFKKFIPHPKHKNKKIVLIRDTVHKRQYYYSSLTSH